VSARPPELVLRRPGLVDYTLAWERMRAFNAARTAGTPDELWLLQHPAVYTAGLSCRGVDTAALGGVPLVMSDRGGQLTYHGPGQWIVYVMVDLERRGMGVRRLVETLEQAVIDLLADYGVQGSRRAGAPGVYVGLRKIAALGLRVRRGATYHGLSFNVQMDLDPFTRIDPCGYRGLEVTQLADLCARADEHDAGERLLQRVAAALGYTGPSSGHPAPGDLP